MEQFRLLDEARQLAFDGSSEPVGSPVAEPCPAPELPVRREKQAYADLFDPEQLPLSGGASAPAGRARKTRDKVAAPFDDPLSAPPSAVTVRRELAQTIRAWGRGIASSMPIWKPLWDVIGVLEGCGATSLPNQAEEGEGGRVDVVVRESSDGKRHLAGVAHCGKHLCPSCSRFNASARRDALAGSLAAVAPQGRHFHLVCTLRHRLGVKWKELADAEKTLWKKQQQRRPWREAVLGFVRADEVTYGANGFHHHLHAILTLKPGADPEAFKAWLSAFWETEARKLGRTADWSGQNGKWWSEIKREDLSGVAAYFTKAASEGKQTPHKALSDVLQAEVLGGTAKPGSMPWDLPVPAFLQVWHASKGHRWFATGGIWKLAAKVESEEDLAELRETTGMPVVSVAGVRWDELNRKENREKRDWLQGIIYNREIARPDFLKWWRAFWTDWEREHPPPKPKSEPTNQTIEERIRAHRAAWTVSPAGQGISQ